MPSKRDYDLELKFQGELIKELKVEFPGCVILKNDSGYQQGIPDLVIFWGMRYAFLEVKPKEPTRASDWQPNQQWFIAHLNKMWFASVIYPGNKEEVIASLHDALSPSE